jgi:hypothetical protein
MKVCLSLTSKVNLKDISNLADLTQSTSSTSKAYAVTSKIDVSKGSLNSATTELGKMTN